MKDEKKKKKMTKEEIKKKYPNLVTHTFEDKEKASKAAIKANEKKRENKFLTEYLKKLLKENITLNTGDYDEDGKEIKITGKGFELIIAALLQNGIKGDNKSIETIFERVEGKVKETKDINVNPDQIKFYIPQKKPIKDNE